uniref:Uncharacterized protein LOC114335154 n=1 Tax=Diabrotica virgifera virgifera TaxID=50390 RepID=A0A6P7FX48_DIAVI
MDVKVKIEHEEVDLPDLIDPELLSEEYGNIKHEIFTCSECLENFNCELLLNRHQMSHDKTEYYEEGIKPYPCKRIARTEKNKRDNDKGNSNSKAEFVNKRIKIDFIEEEKQDRKKELSRLRNIKYRQRLKKAKQDALNQSGIDHAQSSIERKKELSKKSSQRYRDRKRLALLITSRDTVIPEQATVKQQLHVQNQSEIYDSQIAGPSWIDVPLASKKTTESSNIKLNDDSRHSNDSTSDPDSRSINFDSLQKHQQLENINSDNSDNNIGQVDPPNIILHVPEETRTQQSQHPCPRYSLYTTHSSAHLEMKKHFFDNNFGHACDICDRLCFKNDLNVLKNDETTNNVHYFRTLLTNSDIPAISVCKSCLQSVNRKRVPICSVYNGFKYPDFPENLINVPLDFVSERLISPRTPFMQIRRLRRINGQNEIYGQVINIPTEFNTMLNQLPRKVNDYHSITVHIERKEIYKLNYLGRIVNKRALKNWLSYLVKTPLYEANKITIDETFFEGMDSINEEDNEVFENISVEESLLAQQQTLMWNDRDYNVPVNLLLDEHAEELCFPAIYLGQSRKFRDGVVATPFMMATSEIRRSDRRGVTPQHLFYMTLKIMRLRILDALKDAGITKKQMKDPNYLQTCDESKLAFLRSIPNSSWYWLERKKDLFAMIRQLGKPTVFFTISANETGWPDLLQILYKLKNKEDITLENAEKLHYMTKSTLINQDSVTCVIYFSKLVNVVLNVLQSKKYSPFKKFRVLHYFKRIEFQDGSPQAHVLAWLDNAPQNALEENYRAIKVIDSLISVKRSEASGNIKLQTHKHTSKCHEQNSSNKAQRCKSDAPFMPSKDTMILTPMDDSENGFANYKKKYAEIRKNIESADYNDGMNDFYQKNGILTDKEYIKVIRAGINRPKVFLKREPSEKWHNPFNPFLLNVVKSNIDFQFIIDEYSCAEFVVEYMNKINGGVSDLQRKIIETMNEHPEFGIVEATKHIGVNILDQTEITSQEAAWYLLREPMSRSSADIVYIPTVWPIERQKIRKTMKVLTDLEDGDTDIWKENWFEKYEKRPHHLEDVTLAQFVSNYYKNTKREYVRRREPRIIHYKNYDMENDFNEYQREMVTLHIPFRHEESEVLSEMKFIKIYEDNVDRIVHNRQEFESNIDILKTIQELSRPQYSLYNTHYSAHLQMKNQLFDNNFGHACDICDRLFFKIDLKVLKNDNGTHNIHFIRTLLTNDISAISVCKSCFPLIKQNRVPIFSVYNGFKYPDFPENLINVPLDLVLERLISPRTPFMQIRRLRRINGQNEIYGQVINIPIDVNTMINKLPRNVDDYHSVTVHIERKKTYKLSYLCGIVNKRALKSWLSYLIKTPLYEVNKITIDETFFEGIDSITEKDIEVFENIPIEESLVAQQQTLMWNDGECNVPISLLLNEHAEELSFPAIYLGQFRKFRDGIVVTPFMMAASEIRRSDRRGVTPQHLLYMAMKLMRIRMIDSLKDAGIPNWQIQLPNYLQDSTEHKLALLRSIPNSTWYWLEKTKDLFAMIRQLGKPTVFFTISANETRWPDLLQILYKLKNKIDITIEYAEKLDYMTKCSLVNEDSVTCAIYFSKLVNVILNVLQSERCSPFKKFRVLHYFKRIEFQDSGTPQAHVLAWLDNAPEGDYNSVIEIIDSLISVKSSEASGNIKLQTHKHTSRCFKQTTSNKAQKCRFDAPFMPFKNTIILTPMEDSENGFEYYKKKYAEIRKNLESTNYNGMNDFYQKNCILTDEEYIKIIRAGINRPRVFLKREPSEKWHNPFNPFLLNVVKSNIDFQFITDEYSCAEFIVEYINKTNRGVSDLQRKIIETMNEHPEFDIAEATKNIGVNILNQMEITSQEAAWYLLREPMSKTSADVVYIPTVYPTARQRIKKTMKVLSDLEDSGTDLWKENWFEKYEKRPDFLEDVTLAQFVSNKFGTYYKTTKGEYFRREPGIIRYRNYDMADDFNEFRREMVTLHIPFRNEESEILSDMKFIKIYEDNEDIILQNRKEFESKIDIAKTIQIYCDLCREETPCDEDVNSFEKMYNDPDINDDLSVAILDKLVPVIKKEEYI